MVFMNDGNFPSTFLFSCVGFVDVFSIPFVENTLQNKLSLLNVAVKLRCEFFF